MLINAIKQSYRDLMGLEDPKQAIVTVPVKRKAANADNYNPPRKRAVRQRRVSRMGFSNQQASTGWRISAW